MNFEYVNTIWTAEAMRLPNYKVGRVNYGNGRSYVRLLPDGELENPFRLYTSLTTAISQAAPMEDGLLQWYCKLGYDEAKRQTKLAAHYGTLMHLLIGDYLINNFFDFSSIPDHIQAYLCDNDYYTPETKEWQRKLEYDIAAFISFSQEYDITPLGVEYVLLSDRGYGTLIDLVCEMNIEEKGYYGEVYASGSRKGESKESKRIRRIRAIINFKSGRHGFYRTNGIQAICEKQLWEENFPDMPLEGAYNWAPKEWITSPDWTLKNWVGDVQQEEVDSILQLANIRFAERAVNKKYLSISGTAIRTVPIANNISIISAEEYCRRKYTTQPI